MKIELRVNGERREADVWEGESLLLRSGSGSASPGRRTPASKGSAARARSCSTARLSLVPRRGAGGRWRGRHGGRSRRRRPHRVQEAFVETGAVQCGFCTPGLVVATADLLEHTPDPSEDEIREALSGNLCRCTGYAKIFDAVRLAARA